MRCAGPGGARLLRRRLDPRRRVLRDGLRGGAHPAWPRRGGRHGRVPLPSGGREPDRRPGRDAHPRRRRRRPRRPRPTRRLRRAPALALAAPIRGGEVPRAAPRLRAPRPARAPSPRQQRVGLVHGDYRFDNTVLGADDRVVAVLDWELCTLGDPVADFCWSILYWSDPGEPHDFGSPSPTRHPSFPRRADAIEMYANKSGLDLSELDYYRAFSWWKMACLVEGVVARLRAGAGGGLAASANLDETMKRVEWMLECADEAAGSIRSGG
ncbi:MAG: phosphotransferase [Deltaproteobacteria bacterium]|nr:phosphotransferase [Deltaproteobacteria bacterium]